MRSRMAPGCWFESTNSNASPIGPASGPVSVVLALRDSTGAIVSAELRVPAERWDMAAFVTYWNAQGTPS